MVFQGILYTRRLLRRALAQTNNEDDRQKLRKLLDDRESFSDLMLSLHQEHDQHCNAVGLEGKFMDFLDWLIENSDEIIALIMKLLPLFV